MEDAPGSSVQISTFLQELREEMVQLFATSLHLEAGSSSVRTNVKQKIFSLKQMKTELRVADTALNMLKNRLEEDVCL